MMTEEQIKQVLSRYLRGQWPTEAEIAAAPRLENWRTIVVRSVVTNGYEILLAGNCIGHPNLGDDQISTSPIVWLDRERRLAHTMSRLYSLGDPATEASR